MDAAKTAASWGCPSVMIKDFVKSAKDVPDGQRFLEVPADDPVELARLAVEFVSARGARFNRGVVFKEFVPLKKYRDAWGCVRATNEWRCFFGPGGRLLSADRNSNQPRGASEPPKSLVDDVSTAVEAIGSPYMTVDLAEGSEPDGRWFVLEAGEGGVSGPATDQDIRAHWKTLADCFCSFSQSTSL